MSEVTIMFSRTTSPTAVAQPALASARAWDPFESLLIPSINFRVLKASGHGSFAEVLKRS